MLPPPVCKDGVFLRDHDLHTGRWMCSEKSSTCHFRRVRKGPRSPTRSYFAQRDLQVATSTSVMGLTKVMWRIPHRTVERGPPDQLPKEGFDHPFQASDDCTTTERGRRESPRKVSGSFSSLAVLSQLIFYMLCIRLSSNGCVLSQTISEKNLTGGRK